MYLDTDFTAARLERLTSRTYAGIAEGLARATEMVTAKLSETIAPAAVRELELTDPDVTDGERRRFGRVSTTSQVHARRIPGTNFEVALHNVSAAGCRIEMIEECEEGEDIIARFPQLEPLGARVRWTDGPVAGLQFARPIHPAVFGSLLERLSDEELPRA